MQHRMERRTARVWLVLVSIVVAIAAASGTSAAAAKGDDPTAVELVGNWFGTLDTPQGAVGVELQMRKAGPGPTGAQDDRRFEWLALENFGAGFVDVAMGDGTIAAMGQGEINGVGIPGNPAGLLRIEAHGVVEGPPGSMTADFMYRGKNVDNSSIIGVLRLVKEERPG
jgi:hypothetical protein